MLTGPSCLRWTRNAGYPWTDVVRCTLSPWMLDGAVSPSARTSPTITDASTYVRLVRPRSQVRDQNVVPKSHVRIGVRGRPVTMGKPGAGSGRPTASKDAGGLDGSGDGASNVTLDAPAAGPTESAPQDPMSAQLTTATRTIVSPARAAPA